jgi:hypothetical protein
MNLVRWQCLVSLLLVLSAAVDTQAAVVLDTNTITAVDPASLGSIIITSTVFDNFAGDFGKYEFRYDVENLSYDPFPGTSNALSGFNVAFTTAITGIADQYAPAGWFLNCCGVTPPFGAEADIDNSSGFGIPVGGSGSFGFSTPAGTPWTDTSTGSWAHSWEFDSQVNTFDQVDVASGISVLTPVPEPTTFALATLCLLGIGLRRQKRK